MKRIDIKIEPEGNSFILRPLSGRAEKWCKEKMPKTVVNFGNGYVLEQQNLDSILEKAVNAGLSFH